MTTKIKLSGTLQLWASVATQQGDSLEAKILREAAMQLEAGEALAGALANVCALDSNRAYADCAGEKHWRKGIAQARAALAAWKGDA